MIDLARNLKVDSVSRLFPTAPRQVAPDCPVARAVELMRHERIGCVLIAEGGPVLGLFTERDLMQRVLFPGRSLDLAIAQVMTSRPVTVNLKDPIALAIRRMEEGGYRHLPVVDGLGRPVGVLSVKRIVHYLAEHFPNVVYNLPPGPGIVPKEREGA